MGWEIEFGEIKEVVFLKEKENFLHKKKSQKRKNFKGVERF